MSTSLGRLVLDMAANAAGFERDMQRISKSAQKELRKVNRDLRFTQRDLDATRARVNMLATGAAALGGLALAGTVRQFRQMSAEADRIGKLGIQLGISAEAVQELGFAAEQSGSDLEQLARGLVQMQRNIQNATDGLSTQVRSFERMGLSIEQLRGLSADQQFELIADALAGMEDQTQRNASALEIFGRSASNILPLLNQGSAGIQQLREQMRATGGVLSQEAVDAAQRFNDALNVLRNQVNQFRVAIFSDLIEPLANYADWLANTEQGQQTFQRLLDQLADTAQAAGVVIGVAFTAALTKAIVQMALAEIRVARLTMQKLALNGASRSAAIGVTLFGRALSIATGPIGIITGLIATLGIGYLSLRDDIAEASEEFDEFSNRIDRARQSTIAFRSAQLEGDLIRIGARLNEINAELEEFERQQAARAFDNVPSEFASPVTDIVGAGQAERVRELRQEQENLRASAAQLAEELERLTAAGEDAGGGIETTGESASRSRSDIDDFVRSLEDLSDELDGGNAGAYRAFSRQIAQASQMLAQGRIGLDTYVQALRLYQRQLAEVTRDRRAGDGLGSLVDMGKYVGLLEDARDRMQEIAEIEFGVENLSSSFNTLADDMLRLGDAIGFIDHALNEGVIGKGEAGLLKIGASANAAFGAMMQGVDRTSKEYQRLEKAQQIVNVAMGIAAILQQGMGDPYTAIPRMIAMAAMVASLGVDTGGLGGGGGAASRQERQGTGTVLGDDRAKSESIANAIETTADATEALVGINRGMLRALEGMRDAITGASVSIARGGIGEVELPSIGSTSISGQLGFFDPIDDFVAKLFGFNKKKIVDEGIELFGGNIAQIIEQGIGQAFVLVKKKGLFGSKKKTGYGELEEEVASQIELLLESMVDAVKAGAEALGMDMAQIQRAIDQYQIEAQQISLMDLTAEEQQAALEAVFSSIFDGLAGAVVPFIGQFQQVGEGLGETLIRVATGVQVTQEAMRRLGFALDETDPERFAQASEGLLALTGGIDGLIQGMVGFVDTFASDAVKFQVAQDDISRALERVGLAVPATRDGMWQLMQTLDATTEAGREQIAALLEITDAADQYYSTLEAVQTEREGLERRLLELAGDQQALREIELEALDESNRALQRRIWALEDEAALTDFMADVTGDLLEILAPSYAEFNRLAKTMQAQIETAEALGASESQMMRLRQLHQAQMAQFVAGLQESIRTLSDQLFGGDGELASSAQSAASSVSSTMDSLRDSMIRALEGVRDWLDRQIFGDASSATPLQRLTAAQSQFDQAIAAALGGDAGAIGDLPGLADQLLGLASTFFGTSTDDFIGIEAQVRAAMEQVAGLTAPGAGQPPTFAQTANIETATQSTAATAFEQAQLATQLVQQIALLSRITGDAPADIGEEFGIPIAELIEKMTGELPGLTGEALGDYFNDLAGQVDDELSVLLDLQAIQAAQVSHLRNIESILATIAGLPESLPDITTGPQPTGTGTPEITVGPDPIGEAVAEESNATREELRAIREELERIGDLAMQSGMHDRELIGETSGVALAVRESGLKIRQAIEASRVSRRGP